MTPEQQIKKLQDDLKAANDALAAEKKGRADDKAAADKKIAEKDVIIEQKNKDLVGIRKQNSELKELTEEQKAKMSETEIAHHNALLAMQKENSDLKAQREADLAKEVGARRARALDKIVGTKDPELRKKVEEAYGKILDHDKATTDEEILAVAQSAFNMLGVPKPEGVDAIVNGGGNGDAPEGGGGDNFAETKAGKDLLGAMGLPTEAPKAPDAGGGTQ